MDYITVGSSETLAPTLEYPEGLVYTNPQSSVMWSGDGEALEPGQLILIQTYAESLEDGSVLINTFDGLPEPYLLAPEFLGDALYEVISRERVGSRILHISPSVEDEDYPPMALVIDIMPLRADGNEVDPVQGLPTVLRDRHGEPTVVIPDDLDEPAEVTSATVIQGGGTQVRPGSHILVHYKAVEWATGEVFLDTWAPGSKPFATTIGQGLNIAGWEEGLIDQTAGSQVLLVVPPAQGYPDMGTTVFVVDILHVWNPDS